VTTSLPPDAALYHAQAKVFQRSAGRSAVAAAAYRSASKLHDERTGQVFDYSRKHVVTAFIVAPSNSPAWVSDREQLWNRAEFAEVKSNAVVGREWEISIPRDIPQPEWEAFARKIVEPWVEAGAVADIAIHCPSDLYGQPQPHIHIMLTTRKLDAGADSGFSKRKNDALTHLFESGGRHGGKKADALKLERARISGVMNSFLDAAGSSRRTSHLSNIARYPDGSRDPEPTMGEGRLHASRKRKRGDDKTKLVSALRASRKLEIELIKTEEELMSTNPKFQATNGLRPANQQDFKSRLFAQRFPDAASADIGEKLHMIDTRSPSVTRVQTRDGGWIEVESRQIKTYGKRGFADQLARQLYEADYGDHIERLEETAAISKRGLKLRKSHHLEDDIPEEPQAAPASIIETIADRWRSRGYTDVSEALDGVYVRIGSCRIQDLGDELRVHGKPSDPAIQAIVEKGMAEWGAEFEVYGEKSFKDAVWLEAARRGAKLIDDITGRPYEPAAAIRKQWELDLAQVQKQQGQIAGIKQIKKLTEIMRGAASGDKKALESLQKSEPHLALFLVEHLDEAQLREFANEPDESLEKQLDGFREIGRDYAEDISGKQSTTVEMSSALDEALSMPGDDLDDDEALGTDRDSVERAGRENSHSPRLP
jgi:MobA/MobL family/Large polyvalent protein-associated domain 7